MLKAKTPRRVVKLLARLIGAQSKNIVLRGIWPGFTKTKNSTVKIGQRLEPAFSVTPSSANSSRGMLCQVLEIARAISPEVSIRQGSEQNIIFED